MQIQIIFNFRQAQRYSYCGYQMKWFYQFYFTQQLKDKLSDFNYSHFFFHFYPRV